MSHERQKNEEVELLWQIAQARALEIKELRMARVGDVRKVVQAGWRPIEQGHYGNDVVNAFWRLGQKVGGKEAVPKELRDRLIKRYSRGDFVYVLFGYRSGNHSTEDTFVTFRHDPGTKNFFVDQGGLTDKDKWAPGYRALVRNND